VSVIEKSHHRSIDAGPRSIAARRSIGVVLATAPLLLMNACYAFIPTTSTTLAAPTPVSVHLTLGGTVALQSTLGAGVNELDGTVVRSTPDTLVIEVESMYTIGRQKFGSSGTTASLPRPYIEEVKVRTFSRKRSVLMALASLAAVLAAAAGVSAVASGDPGGGGVVPP
jgi:hypothetical protein